MNGFVDVGHWNNVTELSAVDRDLEKASVGFYTFSKVHQMHL